MSLLEFVVLLDIGSINVQVRFLCRRDTGYIALSVTCLLSSTEQKLGRVLILPF